ncbi:MAG: phosphocholine cytidylyltransferase family protein [Myxococcales bacterium]|nr:phosphocholine cytidylyltransferase family protein [Polyangiaceae bacterium]MDW8248151.1 phosphocholine cytidylyltransferase family protein [Myxococcales bacterium]
MAAATPVGVILVAGVGSRLRPLTNDRPKALVDIGGETILNRAVRLLLEAGVSELVLATGYQEDAVRAAMRGCPIPVHYCRNEAFERTQNSVSLWLCREAIAGRPFFKLDGDLLFRPEALRRLDQAPPGLAVAIDFRAGLGAEEMKVIACNGRVLHLGKHLDPAASSGESIGLERVNGVAVLHLFHALEEAICSGETSLYYEDVYARLPAKGVDLWAVNVSDLGWYEVDTLEDLNAAQAQIAAWG